jgi:AcrR family transcriptional regulator
MALQRLPDSPRGHLTRAALIQAALEIFGRDGFDAASTRAIAAAAGTNQALIGYHYGGKEGLYLAVFEHIADRFGERVLPVAAAIRRQLAVIETRALDRQARLDRYLPPLLRLLDTFTAVLVGEEAAGWARLILREQHSPSRAFDLLYARMMGPLTDLTAQLLAGALGGEPDKTRIDLLLFTTLGQALTFRAARASVLRRTGWREIGASELAAIQAQIRRNAAAIVRAEIET